MSKISYQMKPVEEKREATYTKGSIFDPIIDQFLESGHKLVEIQIENRKASYIKNQLMNRIKKRKLDIIASYASDYVYLEHSKKED